MEKKDLGKTSIGIEANLAALLAYAAGWVTGLILFLVEKDNKYVRFHALQSIVVFGALGVAWIAISVLGAFMAMIRLGFVLPLLSGINVLLSLVGLVLWIVLMIKAYQGEHYKLPIAGDIAEKNS